MLLDPRGPRFAAGLTAIVFVLILVTGAWWLALAQAVVFAITAIDPRKGPVLACSTARWSRPRLGPPTEREPAEPVRFAQALGGVFALTAAIAYGAGGTAGTAVGIVAAAFGLAAAFLNSAFGICLGCELYLATRRMTGRPMAARFPRRRAMTTARTSGRPVLRAGPGAGPSSGPGPGWRRPASRRASRCGSWPSTR